jgi:hypothetical protein
MNIHASLRMKIMNVNKQIICGMFFLMKKILFNSFFICILLVSNPSFSNEELIGKALYCDSTEVKYTEWQGRPKSFLDVAIDFRWKDSAIIYQYNYITGYISLLSVDEMVPFRADVIDISFGTTSKQRNTYVLNRQTLELKSSNITAQCRLIKKDKALYDSVFRYTRIFEKIANEKVEKIENEIKAKNKI